MSSIDQRSWWPPSRPPCSILGVHWRLSGYLLSPIHCLLDLLSFCLSFCLFVLANSFRSCMITAYTFMSSWTISWPIIKGYNILVSCSKTHELKLGSHQETFRKCANAGGGGWRWWRSRHHQHFHDTQVPGGSGHAVHCSLLFHQGEAFSQEVQARANFTINLMNSFLPEHLYKMHIFRVKSVKIYTGQKKFTLAPPLAPVTNMRYV